ncbi:hypothetical protein HNP37_004030 [Flavobacterium nitrogenifigens]|uniref:Lipoprotein n=2 Tax=Flavobacterium TaxID=237 RepID=A0A7W7J0N8_9FLAO|nr:MULTISPECIES: hypothetical protein [Flavobacterium]MBB4803950.1 hypothetical protein [Flavobacterium nitrogenifigens]MBB6388898.1 hypothetical protein [Flavobacterium notoginsengisoli]
MKIFKPFSFLFSAIITGCVGNMNPTGGNSTPNYPYFVTTEPMVVKKIMVPKGTKLTYNEHFFVSGEQKHKMSEQRLTNIKLPEGQYLNWGGVPVYEINQFFNSEMRGYSVYADFRKLSDDKKTKFSELWQSCSSELGITIKNTDDWSFNKANIVDVESCSVLYQRYFKDDTNQQEFLNEMLAELRKVGSK